MKNLYIARTSKTPEMIFNTNGKLLIWGRALDVYDGSSKIDYYEPLIRSLDDYCSNPSGCLDISIGIEFMIKYARRRLQEILQKAVSISKLNCQVTINWYYEKDDDDSRETGEWFSQMLGWQFNLLETENIYSRFLTLAQSSY
jgi:hypothetical protein